MKIADVIVSFDEYVSLTFKIPISERKSIEPILSSLEGFSPEREYNLSLKRATKPRSKEANNYLWLLCDEIAKIIRTTKEEVYRKAIREVGVFADVAVQVGEPCKELINTWGSYGIGYFAEMFDSTLTDREGNPMKRVRLYKGSHNYNQRELSRVIDWVVGEAKNLGIETMTPSQIKEMEEAWKQ